MRAVVFLAFTTVGLAQTRSDALRLLHDVADASRALGSFEAEGTVQQSNDLFGSLQLDLTFRVATRSPRQLTIEITGAPAWLTGMPYTATCEGADRWVYLAQTKQYRKVAPDNLDAAYCTTGTLTTFEHLADDLKSAVITGRGTAQFEGHQTPCVEVKAEYREIKDLLLPPALVFNVGRVSRRMCVDPVRKLVLRDTLEGDFAAGPTPQHFTETVTYNGIERNPELPAGLFEFHPPVGSSEIAQPKTTTPAPAPIPSTSGRVRTMPQPLTKLAPEYSQEAWDEGIQGKVILLVDVDATGVVGNIKVKQSLGWGLDEKAIACVRQARFVPASDDGKPIKDTAWIELDFGLPDQRPALPSAGPVSRPLPAPRLLVVTLALPNDLENFYYLVAINFKTSEPCARIQALADGGGGRLSLRGYQVRSLQSRCYDEVATILHDPRLCEQVTPVNVSGLDGSLVNREYCLSHLHGPAATAVPDPHNMEPFVRFMQKLGYDDGRVAEFRHRETPFDNFSSASYGKLRGNAEFLGQVQAGPNYAESRVAQKIRPARPVEYLYEMVAIDTANANLCAKISPNATFSRPRGQTALLQSDCYLDLAFNLRNAMYCASLPRAGTFPFINEKYDSRENCAETVAIYNRPGFNAGLLYYGPTQFPGPSDLQSALVSIGYLSADAAPKVPPDDYWELFSQLALRGTPEQRAEFVRRAMTLK